MKLVNKSFRQGEDGHAKLIPEEGRFSVVCVDVSYADSGMPV